MSANPQDGARKWAASTFGADRAPVLHALNESLPVSLIATSREALVTCQDTEALKSVIERNRADNFDHIPVVEKGRIIGLLETVQFRDGQGLPGEVRRHMTPLSEENLIGENASIFAFLSEASSRPCRLLISRRGISGLVSISDIQRMPARAAIFGLVTAVEVSMLEAIGKLFADASWTEKLSQTARQRLVAYENEARKNDTYVEQLLLTTFSDKISLLVSAPEFAWDRKQAKSELYRIKKLRDALAHVNNYASSREAARSVCELIGLMRLWIDRLAKPACA